jgi:peroxiredoxin Q/BCP
MKQLLSICALMAMFTVSAAGANPAVGEAAPDFRLQDQNFKWHGLGDYAGQWVVLYFYPKADTPGCTTEACEFRDNIFAFQALGAAVMGISVDDVGSQKEFADKYHLPFPLLSDASQDTARSYGVLRESGVANRHTFVIGPDGRIAKHYAQVDPASHSQEVLADLKTLM